MSALSKLKLVAAHAEKKTPMTMRRAKLTGKIENQIAAAKAAIEGRTFTATRVKLVQDSESGSRRQVQNDVRVKPWWWKAANGKFVLALRYGAKPIELAKGKNAIEVGSMEELVAAL